MQQREEGEKGRGTPGWYPKFYGERFERQHIKHILRRIARLAQYGAKEVGELLIFFGLRASSVGRNGHVYLACICPDVTAIVATCVRRKWYNNACLAKVDMKCQKAQWILAFTPQPQ